MFGVFTSSTLAADVLMDGATEVVEAHEDGATHEGGEDAEMDLKAGREILEVSEHQVEVLEEQGEVGHGFSLFGWREGCRHDRWTSG